MEIAQIGQYAENVYFGKPSGLMDQAASSVGGMVYIDFADPDCPRWSGSILILKRPATPCASSPAAPTTPTLLTSMRPFHVS